MQRSSSISTSISSISSRSVLVLSAAGKLTGMLVQGRGAGLSRGSDGSSARNISSSAKAAAPQLQALSAAERVWLKLMG
jgi:hypothetical protein